MILAILAVGLGVILELAPIVILVTRKRGKSFYSEGIRSVNERVTRRGIQDDTFNRKYR